MSKITKAKVANAKFSCADRCFWRIFIGLSRPYSDKSTGGVTHTILEKNGCMCMDSGYFINTKSEVANGF